MEKLNKKLIEEKKKSKNNWKKVCKKFPVLPSILPAVRRIIVIGDIHGDYDRALETLKIAGLIPEKTNNNIKLEDIIWTGLDTVVVQLGDQIDSCRPNNRYESCHSKNVTANDKGDDIKILELFTHLHHKAQNTDNNGAIYSIIEGDEKSDLDNEHDFKGRVISLLGNHELMNVQGDLSYVSRKNIQIFSNNSDSSEDLSNGIENRKKKFSPGNKLANFLSCTRQAAVKIGRNLFIHGGVLPRIANKFGVDDMNTILSLYLQKKLKYPQDYNEILDRNQFSPFYNRSYAVNKNENEYCQKLIEPVLKKYQIDRMIVGHTPQLDGIKAACNDKVILADYGCSNSFDKFRFNNSAEIQVLEILRDEDFYVIKKDNNTGKIIRKKIG